MVQVSALRMRAADTPELITIEGSILALREILGDEIMFTKPFGTYAYAYNVMAKEYGAPFNRIIRCEDNKVAKIYGDVLIVNFQISNNQPRPNIIEFMREDIDVLLTELGLTFEEIQDNRSHVPKHQAGIVTNIEQVRETKYGEYRLQFSVKATLEDNETRATLLAGTLLIANCTTSLRSAVVFLQEVIGHSITDFPTITDYSDLAIIHELTVLSDDANTTNAANALLSILEDQFDISHVYMPENVVQNEFEAFWQNLGFKKTPITRSGLFMDLQLHDEESSDQFENYIHKKQAETGLLQKAMDDPKLSWASKGILQYLFVVDFNVNLNQLSKRSKNSPRTIRKFLDELIENGYIQETSYSNKLIWNFNIELMESILDDKKYFRG